MHRMHWAAIKRRSYVCHYGDYSIQRYDIGWTAIQMANVTAASVMLKNGRGITGIATTSCTDSDSTIVKQIILRVSIQHETYQLQRSNAVGITSCYNRTN